MIDPTRDDAFRDELAERRARRAAKRGQVLHFGSTLITAIECPACLSPVFAPSNSAGERVDCTGCDARLVTVQVDGNVAAILAPGGAP